MARRPPKSPRKIASQKRSRATVNALIEATARILVKEGYDRASTNRIAAAAGVSIGSLYQYFPSKEALVAAVIERHAQDLSQVGRDAFLRVASRPVEIAVRELVAAGFDAHRVDPKLHRVLDEEVPRVARRQDTDAVVRNACALFRAYLEAHRSEIDVADLDLAAFILITTVEALTHAAVLHRPDLLGDEKKGRRVCRRGDSTRAPVFADATTAPTERACKRSTKPNGRLIVWVKRALSSRQVGRRAATGRRRASNPRSRRRAPSVKRERPAR